MGGEHARQEQHRDVTPRAVQFSGRGRVREVAKHPPTRCMHPRWARIPRKVEVNRGKRERAIVLKSP